MLLEFLDFLLHLDVHLIYLVSQYGLLTYGILFAIIFVETGTVFAPFLPGDTLIFIAGVLASQNSLNLFVLFFIFSLAAILGDALNYWIGKMIGEGIIRKNPTFFKPEYIRATENYYKKYGNKTIILARFIPVIRSFAPAVAGIGRMNYYEFSKYNIIGGISWVALILIGGYFFGNIEFVREHLNLVVLFIVLISLIPLIKTIMGKK